MRSIAKLPVSVWISIAAVSIILLGWYLNAWRVIGVKDSFPYLEISKALPELHHLAPQSALPGETVILFGAKVEAFDPRLSRVLIGSLPAEVQNWQRELAQITVKIPQGLIPGRYPVTIQIDERHSAEDVWVEVRLLPHDLTQQIEKGERLLVLVTEFEGGESTRALQTDLIEQMRYHVRDEHEKATMLIEAWPEVLSGNVPQRLRDITSLTNARLILFGRTGTGGNIYPRILAEGKLKRDIERRAAKLGIHRAD